MYNSKLIYF